MIGYLPEGAPTLLRLAALGTMAGFGLPMLFAPLRWARLLGWAIPDDTDLTIYFGRCLGAVLCAMAAVVVTTLDDPAVLVAMHRIVLACAALMVVIHVVGAVEGTQPPAETREIGLWVALLLLSLVCFPGL